MSVRQGGEAGRWVGEHAGGWAGWWAGAGRAGRGPGRPDGGQVGGWRPGRRGGREWVGRGPRRTGRRVDGPIGGQGRGDDTIAVSVLCSSRQRAEIETVFAENVVGDWLVTWREQQRKPVQVDTRGTWRVVPASFQTLCSRNVRKRPHGVSDVTLL